MKLKNTIIFFLVITLITITITITFKHGGILKIQEKALKNLPQRPDFSLTEIHMSEISGQKRFWDIKAKKAIIDKNESNMNDLEGIIYNNSTKALGFVSPFAKANLRNNNIEIYSIKAHTFIPQHDVWNLQANSIQWNRNAKLLQGKGNINIFKKQIFFKGDSFTGEVDLQVFTLKNNVQGLINRKEFDTEKEYDPSANVQIKANEISYNSEKALTQASHNITLTYESITAKGDYLSFFNNKNNFSMKNNIQFLVKKPTNNSTIKATAGEAHYIHSEQTIYLQQDAQLNYEDIQARADNIIYYKNNQYAELKGNVKVITPKQTFTGDTIKVHLDTKKIITQGRSIFTENKL